MAFDVAAYSEELENFLLKMEQFTDNGHPDMEKTLEDVRQFLRGARLEIELYQKDVSEQDTILGIYNHDYYMRRVEEIIQQGEIHRYIACYFNLKHFSVINQKLGRDQGTNIMRLYASRLQEELGEDGIVCRITGDSFCMLFLREKLALVMNYLERISVYYEPGTEAHVTVEARSGYYDIQEEENCTKASDVMDRITLAYHVVNGSSHDSYIFYDDAMLQRQTEANQIENEFQDALDKEEFLVYYQPKVNLRNYSLAGAEALCRWKHDKNLIPPFRFIPILEKSHAICQLDFYMLEHVCKDIRQWLDEGKGAVCVSVNFSRQHMGDSDLPSHILEIIDRYHIPHEYIEIELTETTTDVEFIELKRIVEHLQSQGIYTAVDDFGVGYSSLNLIREISWDVLKIDKSFLPITVDPMDQKYVMFKYLVAMAQNLGLECIVEGVETIEHVKVLKENNCFLAQGFYFDKPLPKEEFETRLVS